jgi:Tfp pilus assembly protein PilN
MPNINLIAARRQEQKKIEQLSRALFFGLVSSIGIVGVLGTYLVAQNVALSTEKRQLDSSIAKLKPVLDEIKTLEDQRDNMAPRVETLEIAQMETLRWCAYLHTVADSIPHGAWLNSMTSTLGKNPEDPALITLSGVAASKTLVSQTMMNLKNKAPLLENVTMQNSRNLPPVDGQTVTGETFNIQTSLASVVMPEPPAKNQKEKTSGTS